ncbi:hypothetical protein A0H81_06976 [Grifola frondosa]|uniref:Uncharacterized protein n=1 Tax=Grifola frondosa TaxID=5627 RepID=A0A1C7M8C9_GRIFR|nr:hypothetical protein A0H81_06976 [Grifola frondosa]
MYGHPPQNTLIAGVRMVDSCCQFLQTLQCVPITTQFLPISVLSPSMFLDACSPRPAASGLVLFSLLGHVGAFCTSAYSPAITLRAGMNTQPDICRLHPLWLLPLSAFHRKLSWNPNMRKDRIKTILGTHGRSILMTAGFTSTYQQLSATTAASLMMSQDLTLI